MQNGKSAIARGLNNGLGFGSTEFHVVRAQEGKVIPEWIWYFVRRLEFRIEGTHQFRGGVGQQRVPATYLATAQIPLPSIEDQHRIVSKVNDCLDRVGEISKITDEQSEAQKFILRSARRELFGAPSALPNDWKDCRLDELANVIYGISEAISNNKDPDLGPRSFVWLTSPLKAT